MARNLYCYMCSAILSLEDTINEKRYGLASVFTVRCRNCQADTQVPTGKQHTSPSGSSALLYDTNTKIALSECKENLLV